MRREQWPRRSSGGIGLIGCQLCQLAGINPGQAGHFTRIQSQACRHATTEVGCHLVEQGSLPQLNPPQGLAQVVYDVARSKRSRFITLVQAATKSLTNFFCESAVA